MLSLKLYSLKFEIYEHFLIFTKMPHNLIWFYYFILEPLLYTTLKHIPIRQSKTKVKKKLLNSSSGPSLGEKYRARTKIKYNKNVFHYTEKEEKNR